jgi:DNA end-binding protein Ku
MRMAGSADCTPRSGSKGNTARKSGSRTGSTSKSRSGKTSSGRSSAAIWRSRSGSKRTKEQLYATAKRLKIEGRSKMSKTQLERAVEKARS